MPRLGRRPFLIGFALLACGTAALTPNDPLFPTNQWPLHNPGGTVMPAEGGSLSLTEDADIDALEAWDITTGSRDVIVAIIDTGVDTTHPDLVANLWVNPGEIPDNGIDDDGNGYVDDIHGYDFIDGDADPTDTSAISHGTRLAGQIGMVGNDGVGGVGVCWEVSLMTLRAQGLEPIGEAIDYAIANGAHIIHTGYGGFIHSAEERAMFKRATDASLLVVTATGNNAVDIDDYPFYPAAHDLPGLLTIGATDQYDEVAAFSNIGANTADLLAPGTPIWSTVRVGEGNPVNYGIQGGTSFSAPHATGVAALYLAEHPGTSGLELASRIIAGVERPSGVAGVTRTGGRLSAVSIWSDDSMSPAAVNDMVLNGVTPLSAEITFTAPGDDGLVGNAAMLDVRLSDVPLTEQNWFDASRVWDVPPPASGGEPMTITVARTQTDHLRPNHTFHVGVRAFDEAGNWSPVGESLAFSTPPVVTVLRDDFESPSGLWMSTGGWVVTSESNGFADSAVLRNATSPLPPSTEILFSLTNPVVLGEAGGNWLMFESAEVFDLNPESPTEGVAVEISVDGNTWEIADLIQGISTPLRHHLLSLDAWAGESVLLRFRLFTDGDENEAGGVWLDNVHIFQVIDPPDHAGVSTR